MVSDQELVLRAGGATIILYCCNVYNNSALIWVSAAFAPGGSEVTLSTRKLEYTGSNLHSVTILHFFFFFLSFFFQKIF